MPVFRKIFCREQLIRDLNEDWLIMFVGMFVRWNSLRQLELPPMQDSAPHFPWDGPSDSRLVDVFFGAGLLAFILPYRRYWVPRCQNRIQLLMLAAEVLLLLRVVEFNDEVVWQPFLGIYRDMFEILGSADFRIYCLLPGVAEWLADGRAYEFFQLLVSFGFFVAGIHCIAEEWIRTVNLLLLGGEPEQHPGSDKGSSRKGARGTTTSDSTMPTPDYLMYSRLCKACIHDAAVAGADDDDELYPDPKQQQQQQQQGTATNEPKINPEINQSQKIPQKNY